MQPHDVKTAQPHGARDLALASEFLKSAWFPLNQKVIGHIRVGLLQGRYPQHNSSTLLADLKQDISLYLYMLPKLARAQESGMFNRSAFESLLPSSAQTVCAHDLTAMKTQQARQIQEAVRAACVTETLAEAEGLDLDLAFSVAALRKLGLLLMAWNYPHLFERACTAASSTAQRDENLTRLIGFSPKLLAIAVARSWGLDDQYRIPLGDRETLGGGAIADLSAEKPSHTLEKLCQIGETLAQLSRPPESDPSVVEWTRAKNEVIKRLGARGFKVIEKRIGQGLRYYRENLPELFSEADCVDKVVASEQAIGLQLMHANVHLRYLGSELQEEMRALYERISPKTVSKSSLEILIESIIPKAGFKRGCVYLLDPPSGNLVPRVALGQGLLQQFKSFAPGYMDVRQNPLAAAYRLSTPMVQEERGVSGSQIKFIAAALGDVQKLGLLYLEPHSSLTAANQAKALLHFKAIRAALVDCLTLY